MRAPALAGAGHVCCAGMSLLLVWFIRAVQAVLGTAQPRVCVGACDGVRSPRGSAAGAGPGAQPAAGVDPGGGAAPWLLRQWACGAASTPCRVPEALADMPWSGSCCQIESQGSRRHPRRALPACRQVEALSRAGVKEVTLLGQNVNSYADVSACEAPPAAAPDPFSVYAEARRFLRVMQRRADFLGVCRGAHARRAVPRLRASFPECTCTAARRRCLLMQMQMLGAVRMDWRVSRREGVHRQARTKATTADA